jgi:tRNA pseudouridine38-40 synthase
MPRIALQLEYDGTPFEGWQSQPHGNTVQDTLEKALAEIAGHAVRVQCAGRTDTGVHARAQVVHFDTGAARPLHAWVKGTNTHLPQSVAVRAAIAVPETFHARFSAISRSYEYHLLASPVRPAIDAARVGWFHLDLDVGAMREAAQCLMGEHDFSSFRSSQCQAHSPVRQLHEISLVEHSGRIIIALRANGFLHHMVRNIVGSLVYVGKGAHPPGWLNELLEARDRARAAPTFAPQGLYLTKIEYPDEINFTYGG